MNNLRDHLAQRIEASVASVSSLRHHLPVLTDVAGAMIDALKAGGTVYTAGNGGSAAQALHLAEELIGRFRANRAALRAVCLNADPTALTCIANDFGFEQVFARQCEALVSHGDVLVALSTSGQSRNIVTALEAARARGGVCIGLLGNTGGAARSLCDFSLVIASNDSAVIQDAHQVAVHLLCEAIELAFSSSPAKTGASQESRAR